MAQSAALIDTLKRLLRAHRITYAEVARALRLSEASVKRLFASGKLSLQRFEAICGLMGLEVTDLVRLMDEQRERIVHLTRDQEEELVADTRLLLVAVCVNGHWRFEDIVRHYAISATECIRLLARLDRLKLIELQPGNRIKRLVAPGFRWIPGGPIEHFFEAKVQNEFLHNGFKGENDLRLYLNGSLTPASIAALHRKLLGVVAEFNELLNADTALPLEQRQITGLVLAMRHWELAAFKALRREVI